MIWTHSAIVSLLFFCFGFFAHAANPGDVVINEIAWMGSLPDAGETVQQAANDEWIELYNQTSSTVSLAGWKLIAADGRPEIILTSAIEPQGYFLLSRANQKVSGIAADLVYPYKNNSLSNEGEHLQLFDAQGNLVDEVTSPPDGWFAGDNITKQTMERKNPKLTGPDPVSWGTSVPVGGTPKLQNSLSVPPPQPEVQPEPLPPPPLPPSDLAPEGNNSSTTSNSTLPAGQAGLPPLIIRGGTEGGVNTTTTTAMTTEIKEVKEVKKIQVIKKSENKNASPATSTPPSLQVAAIGDAASPFGRSPVGGQNKNIFMYVLALLLALISAGTILILKKRLQK